MFPNLKQGHEQKISPQVSAAEIVTAQVEIEVQKIQDQVTVQVEKGIYQIQDKIMNTLKDSGEDFETKENH